MTESTKTLAGTVALVTGAGRGIGRAIALRLAEEGAALALFGRSVEGLEETAALIDARGGAYHVAAVDVRVQAQVADALREATSQLGPIDLLVNNAGSNVVFGPTWAIDPAAWWSDIETNLYGPFLLAHLVLPSMIERRQGRIVNIASGAGNVPFPYNTAYACSKVAIVRLTDSLAQEVAEFGLSVFALSPGSVREGIPSRLAELPAAQVYIGDTLDTLTYVEATVPADAVAFLATGAADALSGRFFAVRDDVRSLPERAQEIADGDYFQIRLRMPD